MGRNSVEKDRKINPKKHLEIITGLIDFLQTNSLAASNMDDIALGLNKSKATLYKYFTSKEAMVDALVMYKVEEISKFVLILNNENIPFIDRYEQSFALLLSHIGVITNDFLQDLKEVFPEIYAKIELLIQLAAHELAKYYQKGMDLGLFNNLNAMLLSQNDFVFFRTLTDPDFLKANHLSMQQAFEDFYKIRCLGLLPFK